MTLTKAKNYLKSKGFFCSPTLDKLQCDTCGSKNKGKKLIFLYIEGEQNLIKWLLCSRCLVKMKKEDIDRLISFLILQSNG